MPFLKSEPGAEPVVVEGIFRAPPDRVFRAWTDENEVASWFGPGDGRLASAQIDLRVGGAWRFDYGLHEGRRDVLRGEYLDILPGKRLVFSWVHERTTADGEVEVTPGSQVSITFDAAGGGTSVRLVHERISRETGRLGVGEGWSGTFVNLTKRFVAEEGDR
ncbi:MAG: SRPBCC domain-containing protein [Pseudomonadota bacterium]